MIAALDLFCGGAYTRDGIPQITEAIARAILSVSPPFREYRGGENAAGAGVPGTAFCFLPPKPYPQRAVANRPLRDFWRF